MREILRTESNEILCQVLIRMIYEEAPSGADLHIVLDDYNVENHWIHDCIKNIADYIRLDGLQCAELCVCALLLTIPYGKRIKLIREATEPINLESYKGGKLCTIKS